MIKDLLPIGSVVLLRNGVKKLMIMGVKTINTDTPETVYDYLGVLFPEGYLGDEGNFMFNHEDITDVVFRGYDNPERHDFIHLLEQAYEREKDE